MSAVIKASALREQLMWLSCCSWIDFIANYSVSRNNFSAEMLLILRKAYGPLDLTQTL